MSIALRFVTQAAWALDEAVLLSLTDIVANHARGVRYAPDEIRARISAGSPRRSSGPSSGWYKAGRVGVIPISGVIAKHASQVEDVSQPQGTSCDEISAALDDAFEDDGVDAILLDIDSPGGCVDGVADLADKVAAVSARKPITAFGNGVMASAAYWIGSRAGRVACTQTATVGSIGVYTVALDTSKAAESAGYKVNVVRAGAMKGSGTRGAPISAADLAESQRYVDQIYGLFVGSVAKGRGITPDEARALGDGRVHVGASARAAGLVDSVETFQDLLARLQAGVLSLSSPQPAPRASPYPKGNSMAAKPTPPELTARERFDAAFTENLRTHGGNASKAMSYTIRENADLHREMLAEAQAAMPPRDGRRKSSPVGGLADARARFDAEYRRNLAELKHPGKAMSKTVFENKELHALALAEASGR